MIVYTALFGDHARDQLQSPVHGCTATHVCFTDGPTVPAGWIREVMPLEGRSPSLVARLVKTRPDRWFGVTTTIWADASCRLTVPASDLIAARPEPIVALCHPDRSTVNAEAAVVVQQGLASATSVAAQLAAYRLAGFPLNTPTLTTTGVMVRRPDADAFNRLWEEQLIRYHLRDQLSVDYCAWATQTPIGYLNGSYRENAFMSYRRHARLAS